MKQEQSVSTIIIDALQNAYSNTNFCFEVEFNGKMLVHWQDGPSKNVVSSKIKRSLDTMNVEGIELIRITTATPRLTPETFLLVGEKMKVAQQLIRYIVEASDYAIRDINDVHIEIVFADEKKFAIYNNFLIEKNKNGGFASKRLNLIERVRVDVEDEISELLGDDIIVMQGM